MQRFGRVLAIAAIGVAAMLTVVDVADARRAGGGFGSRGSRTFSAPPATRTAPAPAAPIDRTMTPRQNAQPSTATSPATQNRTGNARPGFFSGFGGSMIGGLMMGGLIGMLLGHGIGGGVGFLGLLLQVGLVVLLISLAMRFFGRNQRPAYSAPSATARTSATAGNPPSFRIPRIGEAVGSAAAPRSPAAAPAYGGGEEISVGQDDLDRFETMLKGVQAAYGAEDYAALRRLTTPEAMSYLAEELSDNATKGLKNEVRDVHLVQGDLAEAWRGDGRDYATVAMRYESVDVIRDRATGDVVSGDADRPTEAVEIWTFVRRPGADWQVSAIQGVEA
ncbi:hypothetical protein GOD80_31735 [Sinorhizobium medicae]|nr:hypothetical protein [Sinorhizobium medicae]